ncbi:MAG TPA: DUF998 domain-containing protein [Candidatus Dormibacteraeota bacterium]|nr:DUF998 domain-containing protein [Candidatus Dormibacteraeota bacterium]
MPRKLVSRFGTGPDAVPTAERLAAVAGVAVPPLAAVAVAVIGVQTPGYDPVHRTVSRLAEPGAPYSLAVKLILAALGLSIIAVAWTLDRRLTGRGAAGVRSLAIAGAALVGVAFVSRDAAHPAVLATHRLIAIVLFCALAIAPLLAAGRLRRDPAFSAYATPSVATSGVSIALIAIAVAGVVVGGLPSGAWERTFIGLNLVWMTLLSVRLMRARPASLTCR